MVTDIGRPPEKGRQRHTEQGIERMFDDTEATRPGAETGHIVGAASASEARRRDTATALEEREREARENRDFVQVYAPGWRRMQALAVASPGAMRLYMLLAEHIGTNGAVVAPQTLLAETLKVDVRTIRRWTKILEDGRALVAIRVEGGAMAYALNPEEVWRAYDSAKPFAVFNTRTMVKAQGKEASIVLKKLATMMRRDATDVR